MKRVSLVIIILLFSISVARAQDFIFSPINVLQGLSDNQVRYIIQLADGRMVFKTSGNINIYDGARFKYIHQRPQHIYPLKAYDGFYRIYQYGDSVLWIKDHGKLMCVDLRTEKYLSNLSIGFSRKGFKEPVDDVFFDSTAGMWLLTGGQLVRMDRSQSIQLSASLGVLQDLSSDSDNLYLFYNTGIVVCYNLKTMQQLYSVAAYPPTQQALFSRTSLVVKGKNGFYQLRNGIKGGFFFFDTYKRSWEKILETSYVLNTLVVDQHGTVSISCPDGLWIIDRQTGKKRNLPALKTTDGNIINTEISTLFYDRQGGLWLGTLNQGLFYYHPSRYMFTHVGKSDFKYSSKRELIVQSFAEDGAGNIYLKCGFEIYQYRPLEKNNLFLQRVDMAFISQEILEKLNSNSLRFANGKDITTQLTDIRGWRWSGTADGLRVFDPKTQKEKVFYTSDGLSNNFIHALLQDQYHNIWISTSYGINKAQVELGGRIHFSSFGSNEGTLDGEYTDGAAFKSTNGALYFGGINGFSILKPQDADPKNLPFKPVFTRLFLRGEKIEPLSSYDGRILLNTGTAYTSRIELSYDQNFLTFEFSALNYQNPSHTYYRYQMEGIDREWRETSARRGNDRLNNDGVLDISYTNLPPGKYKLKVIASNNDLDWNGTASVLYVTINAPWWKTTTAYILFSVLSFIVVVASTFIYMRIARNKLERIHREEILLLRIRNLIDQQNARLVEEESCPDLPESDMGHLEGNYKKNQADAAFLARALKQVEKNLHVATYSVVDLSRDLNMDRTGLYRKLITLLDKSPSLFIRNIRLEKAAALILEGELNIAQITERVGFSSSSYLSKCFQEQYGCRPSEYAQKAKIST